METQEDVFPSAQPQARAAPELVAPAGDRDCAKAAVENGADAVYFGLAAAFNARARAVNFSLDDLPELMALLRRRGVKGYLALNTLVFPKELEELERTVRRAVAAGVDAVLVQDLGALRLIRALCPQLPIHASTQMALTSAECIRAVESLGLHRVVLPRELSLEEIAAIHRQTAIPLEAFVHGSLCVAYSGQCLTSESLGGRSANRGQCAQACRMPYALISDEKEVALGDRKYLLSPQDLAAFDLVPELIDSGVSAMKIEGRLKTAQYVANITRYYRLAIDAAMSGRRADFSPRQIEEMEVSFSRGFSRGWLEGCNHKALVPALWSTKRGAYLGEVKAVRGVRVTVELACPIKRGDGVVFEGDRMDNTEQGSRVYEVFQDGQSREDTVSGGLADLTFGRRAIHFGELWPGQKVWKTDDPELARRLRKTYAGPDPRRRMPLDLVVEAAVGSPLRIAGRAASGAQCRLESPQVLEEALQHPLTAAVLSRQLGRLGGTPYHLRRLEAKIDGKPMIPLSVLGKLRHEMVEQLDAAAVQPPLHPVATQSPLAAFRATLAMRDSTHRAEPPHAGATEPRLHVLCRRLEQLESVVACGARSVIADFQDLRQYPEAVRIAHAGSAQILLATPRIQKPGETGIFRLLARHGADGLLLRNLAGLLFYGRQGIPLVADFSLNAANQLAVQWLYEQGAQRVTASYDLNRDQLLDLVAAVPPEWLEVVVHQHMPMFHMEHCVFCALLSPGTNKTDCGRPCARHMVRLRDRIGMEHPLSADAGCRNTLFNAVPQSAAEAVPLLRERGIRHFRIELLASTDQVSASRLIELYGELLGGRVTGREVWGRLRATNRVGVTRGTLEERRNPYAIL